MKIALVNYRYFISGGPERYYFNIKEVLERHGHTVVPFSIKGPKTSTPPMSDISWTRWGMRSISRRPARASGRW